MVPKDPPRTRVSEVLTDLTSLPVDKRVEPFPVVLRGKAENLERDLSAALSFRMNPPSLLEVKCSDDGTMNLLMLEATTIVPNKRVGLGAVAGFE